MAGRSQADRRADSRREKQKAAGWPSRGSSEVTWSRDQTPLCHHVQRVAGARELPPHPAEHLAALLFLAGGLLVLEVAALPLLLPVAPAVLLIGGLALGRLLDVQTLDVHALRLE